MNVAITGGTGFVGRHLARRLVALGHPVVLLARGVDRSDPSLSSPPGPPSPAQGPRMSFVPCDLGEGRGLEDSLRGVEAVVHLAGINREEGRQTFERVHVEGTRRLVEASRRAGTRKLVLLSFLRARPACGSPYHESKWEAEELVRTSRLDFTVFKAGVIYGRGDNMLDHLSRGLSTVPVFPLVGRGDRRFRPLSVEDAAGALLASLEDARLAGRTLRLVGPEELTFRDAVARVAGVLGRRVCLLPSPVGLQRLLARLAERVLVTPLVSVAQVQMLDEGMVEAAPFAEDLPADLQPRTPFSPEVIARGLPPARRLGLRDLRCFAPRRHA